jgi:hypothetical protein
VKTYEVLEKALAELEKGWCSRQREDGDGNVCAIGALGRAVHGFVDNWHSSYELADDYGLNALVIEKQIPRPNPEDQAQFGPHESIEEVNDDYGKGMVVALFQEAIRNEKAKEGVPVEVLSQAEVPA